MNIAVYTSIYPFPNQRFKNSTDIVHKFSKEWVKLGHNVTVIHCYPSYPGVLHLIFRLFENLIASKTGKYIPRKKLREISKFVFEGVLVIQYPLYRIFPGTKYKKERIDKLNEDLVYMFKNMNFKPDLVLGHFHYPQIEFIAFNKIYYNARTALTIHGDASNLKRHYKKDLPRLLSKIDFWGFRSKSIQKTFKKEIFKPSKSFICHSGVSDEFRIENDIEIQSFSKLKYIFVGSLIKRKKPLIILKALEEIYEEGDFLLTVIGDGQEKWKLNKYIRAHKLNDKVKLLGYLKRDEINSHLSSHNCFIMISKNESFGLVYLEAMRCGCIVIASKNEGMDGIIIDGYNGFLCNAGDKEDLKKTINRILKLSPKERLNIASNALITVENYTDDKVAFLYLKNLELNNG